MNYTRLGSTGLYVSRLCLGTMQCGWTADEPTSFQLLDEFMAAGGNFIDTADIYSSWAAGNPGGVSETIIGNWLHQRNNRQDVVLATKVRGRMWQGPNGEGLSRSHILRAVDDSLHRLQTDYIDLYQTHWYDENTPIAETLDTMNDLVRAGKVRYIGCSNISAWRLMQALSTSEQHNIVRYDSLQPHYNLIHRAEYETDLREVCEQYGIGVIPYSPLAGGFLTGKYRRDKPHPNSVRAASLAQRCFNERSWNIIDTLDAIAVKHGRSMSHVALAWLLAQPDVTAPIIGANSVEQLSDTLGCLSLQLNDNDIQQLNTVSQE